MLPAGYWYRLCALVNPFSDAVEKRAKAVGCKPPFARPHFPLASEKGQVGIFRLFFDHPFLLQAGRFLLFGLRPTRCSLAAARHSKEFYTKNGVWWVFPTTLKLVCMNISFISNYNETVFRNVLAIALANPRGVHRLMAVRRA